jgi:hypothetical protein
VKVLLSKRKKILTVWLKQTKLLHTSEYNDLLFEIEYLEKLFFTKSSFSFILIPFDQRIEIS